MHTHVNMHKHMHMHINLVMQMHMYAHTHANGHTHKLMLTRTVASMDADVFKVKTRVGQLAWVPGNRQERPAQPSGLINPSHFAMRGPSRGHRRAQQGRVPLNEALLALRCAPRIQLRRCRKEPGGRARGIHGETESAGGRAADGASGDLWMGDGCCVDQENVRSKFVPLAAEQ